MPTLITLVGYPAAGKSTYSEQLKKEGWTIISSDQAIGEVLGKHGLTRIDDWRPYREEVHTLLDEWLKKAVMQEENIVFDALNTSVKRRAKHLDLVKMHKSYCFEAVIVHPPEEEEHADRLLGRTFRERHSNVLDAVYQLDLANKYEAPTVAEGYSKITEIGTPPKRALFAKR